MANTAPHTASTDLPNGSAKEKEFDKAQKHAKDAARHARASVEEAYAEARDTASDAYERARAEGRHAYETAQLRGREAVEEGRLALAERHGQIEAYVRSNPTTALLGAAGVGLVLGMILKSRR
ncbi:DUF883 family protein [Sagittula stellata]|uniref:DUF883 domain-containing protein n=1 Tax=Sagittula stellata (strain ATCC 700073 / DSM 11524 / E-37) TaxID=388399 RepID=A3K2K9_SAGS3|nr:hypothetical protein [Sagittula stellata]EBA08418.1 hypothetical protein SSE37_16438 [Sagittula stellata E-37]